MQIVKKKTEGAEWTFGFSRNPWQAFRMKLEYLKAGWYEHRTGYDKRLDRFYFVAVKYV